jgi:DNA anti-recombination protein RmuC
MTVVDHLNRLDALILNKTKPPVTARLRNALSTAREQVEALEAAHLALKNTHTVLKNQSVDSITHLQEENQKLVAENARLISTITEFQKKKRWSGKVIRPRPGHATGEAWAPIY